LRLEPIAPGSGRPSGTRGAHGPVGLLDASDPVGRSAAPPVLRVPGPVTLRHPERLGREQKLRNSREFVAVQTGGTLFRGRCALLLVLPRPGEPTRVGFIASKRGVGGAVQRNRARRRLREIVRRRWARVAEQGYWMVFIASRAALDAPHERLVTEVESLLASAGIIAAAGAGH
jgi:ribonuclease P protein component